MKREITEKEVLICNAIGVVLSLACGIIAGGSWIFVGLLGTYFIPIPIIMLYIGFRNLMGDDIAAAKIQFRPGMTWAGKKYEI